MKDITFAKLSQVKTLAGKTAQALKGGEIFALLGPLGSGKTAFVKAVGKALKIKRNIPSPTFILMQGFEARLKNRKEVVIFHLDLYRLHNFREVKALGLTEFWGKPNTVTFIEWADKIERNLPKKTKFIKFITK